MHNIIEAGKIVGENVDKGRSRMIGFCYAIYETALVILQVAISRSEQRAESNVWSHLI
jgi:hypothetical protein